MKNIRPLLYAGLAKLSQPATIRLALLLLPLLLVASGPQLTGCEVGGGTGCTGG